MKKQYIILFLILCIVGFLLGYKYIWSAKKNVTENKSPGELSSLSKIVVESSTPSSNKWLYTYVIEKEGLGKKYGLDIEWKDISTSEGPRALLANDVNIAFINPFATIRANTSSDKKMKIFGFAYNINYACYALESSNINTVNDLKGKTIVTSSKGSTGYAVLDLLITNMGYNLEQDFKILSVPLAASVVALEKNEAAATCVTPYNIVPLDDSIKLKTIINLNDLWFKEISKIQPYTGIGALEEWLKDHTKEALAFRNAWNDAGRYINDHPELFQLQDVRENLKIVSDQDVNDYIGAFKTMSSPIWDASVVAGTNEYLSKMSEFNKSSEENSFDIYTLYN